MAALLPGAKDGRRRGIARDGAVSYLNRCRTVSAKYAVKATVVNSVAGVVVGKHAVGYLQRRSAGFYSVVVNAPA